MANELVLLVLLGVVDGEGLFDFDFRVNFKDSVFSSFMNFRFSNKEGPDDDRVFSV